MNHVLHQLLSIKDNISKKLVEHRCRIFGFIDAISANYTKHKLTQTSPRSLKNKTIKLSLMMKKLRPDIIVVMKSGSS